MARKPRIHYPGAVFHVILRGNAGHPVFFDHADHCRFYLLLQEVTAKFNCLIHAFCCMSNHIHIVLQVGIIPLSKIMQSLALRYTRWINRKNHQAGHVFQGRFKAILIDSDRYLLELVRYIHLNPVRAGMVSQPEEYPWSGHNVYIGQDYLLWLTTDWVLAQFSDDATHARSCYCRHVFDGMGESVRPEFQAGLIEGRILGNDYFADEALHKANQQYLGYNALDEIVNVVCSYFKTSCDKLAAAGKSRPQAEARAVVALLTRESVHSLTDLGVLLNRDVASLSQAARRLEVRLGCEPSLIRCVDEIKAVLNDMKKSTRPFKDFKDAGGAGN